MGACVSLCLSVDSKNENLVISSPVKQSSFAVNGRDHSAAVLAVTASLSLPGSRGGGSKDDAFFDSQPWLESDCEDEFLSVNGDFTPSRGSTPVHHRFSSGNPAVNKPQPVPEPLPEPLQESLRHQQGGDKEDEASEESVVAGNEERSGRTGNEEAVTEEQSVQCCIPRLRSRRPSATARVEKV
ncbi:hypothetical protein SASPL_151574 [Salvia splendens]|uniref:Uncharacterized protein n=1 Tax=Salvia splendens TaxID=180675 RepID=A0A8X8W939_SALSN|nr:uncharacterized protein At3g27210-like [Salvia splendens]KAG6390094.1 hypothetical protein SASPL_151574 [Salvia splendens]